MAAGNFVPYKSFLFREARSEFDFLDDAIRAILLDNAHTPDAANDRVYADVSADECNDGDYAAQTLATKTITQDGSDRTVFDAGDVDYGAAVTIEARYIALHSNDSTFSVRNTRYAWTVSGSGTSEYYLRTSGSADPDLPEPTSVKENGSAMTGGTVGTLTAGQWDYGDNDSLGYSTIYVRLTDSTDPDGKALDYVEAVCKWLMGYMDLNSGGAANISSVGGDFKVNWHASGIVRKTTV